MFMFQFFDPGEVLYLYESPAGYGILALRLLGWAWFLYAIFFTLKHFPEKSKFYFPFLAFYTIWYVSKVYMYQSCLTSLINSLKEIA